MKKFKVYDTWISIILITGFTIASLVRLDETFLLGYFIVGGWHIISMLVHSYYNWFTEKGGTRWFYHRVVLCLFATLIIGAFFHPVSYMLACLLLVAAPFMAIGYTAICYREVYIKMQRPLALLK